MRWPFMLRKTHDACCDAWSATLAEEERQRELDQDRYQVLVDREYARAREEGRRQVYEWASKLQENLFYGSSPFPTHVNARLRAALPGAENKFNPSKTKTEEK